MIAPNLASPCRPTVRLLAESQRDEKGRFPTIFLQDRPDLSIVSYVGNPVDRWTFDLAA